MGKLAEISVAYQNGMLTPDEYLKAFALQIARIVTDGDVDEMRMCAEALSTSTEE